MRKIQRPFPFSEALAQNDLFLKFGLITRVTRFQIQSESHFMICRIDYHPAIFNGYTIKVKIGVVLGGYGVTKTFRALVEIKRDAVIVADSVFKLFTDFEPVVIVLSDSLVATGGQPDPLFVFHGALG